MIYQQFNFFRRECSLVYKKTINDSNNPRNHIKSSVQGQRYNFFISITLRDVFAIISRCHEVLYIRDNAHVRQLKP